MHPDWILQVARDENLPLGWLRVDPIARTLPELMLQLHGMSKPGWSFRGEPRIDCGGMSSLGRCLKNQSDEISRRTIESLIIREFRNQASVRANTRETEFLRDIPGCIFLMRHYGAPARIIDWTDSVWVAAYFAASSIENKNSHGVIWCADLGSILPDSTPSPESTTLHRMNSATHESEWATAFNDEQWVVPLKETRHTERTLAQQAHFTISNPICIDHREYIGKRCEAGQAIAIVVEGQNLIRSLMQHLLAMDLHAASLYPGLDGSGMFVKDLVNWGLKVRSLSQPIC